MRPLFFSVVLKIYWVTVFVYVISVFVFMYSSVFKVTFIGLTTGISRCWSRGR